MTRKSNFVFFVLLLFLIGYSCSEKSIFSEYKSLKNSSWKSNEKITFSFTIKDTISPKNIFINIRNNNQYEYSNLYVITSLKFPDGTKIIDTLQYEMADKNGKFLGDGFTEIKENKLFYKERKLFPNTGKYHFNIYHAMRKNGETKSIPLLKGIQDVGISIENY